MGPSAAALSGLAPLDWRRSRSGIPPGAVPFAVGIARAVLVVALLAAVPDDERR